MTVLNQDDRYHIEERLGRALTDADLAEAATFDDLSREQLELVVRLQRSRLLASVYLRAVVPSVGFSDVRNVVFAIKDFIAEKYRPAPLAAEHLYEGELGRPLTDQERQVVDAIPDLKEAHGMVARQLASRDRALVRRHLREVLRSAPEFEIEVLIDYLRRESDP
jgi:hypothetical protein